MKGQWTVSANAGKTSPTLMSASLKTAFKPCVPSTLRQSLSTTQGAVAAGRRDIITGGGSREVAESELVEGMYKHTSVWRRNEPVWALTVMGFLRTSAFFVTVGAPVWFIMLLLCPGQQGAQLGTTPNIKAIVVGRCYSYITLVNPSWRFDCEEIWRQFEEAVVRQSSCNVTAEDYHQMFYAMPQSWPCDRFLFWSKTRTLMHSYAAVVRHFWTLEDTLVGYMFNDLVWCGQEEDSGFDFSSCPEWSACRNHPVYSLWRQASLNFAETACGNITVLLNGSIANAFNKKSMFGSVELDGLNPHRVDYVNIKVVTNLGGPFIESCSQGSIVDLIQILQSRGFRWTCTDNDQTLMILQCIQSPKQPSCQTCADSLSHRTALTNS